VVASGQVEHLKVDDTDPVAVIQDVVDRHREESGRGLESRPGGSQPIAPSLGRVVEAPVEQVAERSGSVARLLSRGTAREEIAESALRAERCEFRDSRL
jgi:hypothetical protein